ncbi:hypothetical protein [Fibrella forsythiae]|uniref:Uncharacterized protein n=1 Tax=Fibrella forsythiae TaxID=2817061 RepID=A0ABS3JMK3_9BACT|nr:hypothetical protein [Fibrella forsythiae]MBO0951229.1 hypothetical protein [Fibrella forsythiae]
MDRFLVSKFDHTKLVIVESVFPVASFIGCLYVNKTTIINVVTNKGYFFVLYDDDGIKKKGISTKGLFDKAKTICADSNVHVNKALEYDVQINTPKAWNYNFISKKREAIISNKRIIVEIYARNLNEQQTDAKLSEEIFRLQK